LEMRERAVRIPFRGTRPPSGAPAQQGRGGHGWRRPWGRAAGLLPRARFVTGRQGRGKVRSDRRVPRGSERKEKWGKLGRLAVLGRKG
jgi:hypothetical protein